jgi:hypothetical protein
MNLQCQVCRASFHHAGALGSHKSAAAKGSSAVKCIHGARCPNRHVVYGSRCELNVHLASCVPRDEAWHAEQIRLALAKEADAEHAVAEHAAKQRRLGDSADDNYAFGDGASAADEHSFDAASPFEEIAASQPPSPTLSAQADPLELPVATNGTSALAVEYELHVLLYDLVTTGHLSTTVKRKLLSAVNLAFAAGQAAPAQRHRVPETWSQVERAVQLLVSRIDNEPGVEPFFKSVTLPLPVGIEGAAHLLAPEASRKLVYKNIVESAAFLVRKFAVLPGGLHVGGRVDNGSLSEAWTTEFWARACEFVDPGCVPVVIAIWTDKTQPGGIGTKTTDHSAVITLLNISGQHRQNDAAMIQVGWLPSIPSVASGETRRLLKSYAYLASIGEIVAPLRQKHIFEVDVMNAAGVVCKVRVQLLLGQIAADIEELNAVFGGNCGAKTDFICYHCSQRTDTVSARAATADELQRPANTLASVLRLPFFEKETMIAFDMLHIVWLGVVKAQFGAFLRAVPESVLPPFNAFLTRQCYAYAGIGRLVNGTADLWNGGDYKALAYSLPFALAALAPIAVADLADAVNRRLTVALLQSHIKAATLLADLICAISRPAYNANTLAATATVIETWCTFVVANISRGAAQHWNFPKFHLLRNHVVPLIRQFGTLSAQTTSPYEATTAATALDENDEGEDAIVKRAEAVGVAMIPFAHVRELALTEAWAAVFCKHVVPLLQRELPASQHELRSIKMFNTLSFGEERLRAALSWRGGGPAQDYVRLQYASQAGNRTVEWVGQLRCIYAVGGGACALVQLFRRVDADAVLGDRFERTREHKSVPLERIVNIEAAPLVADSRDSLRRADMVDDEPPVLFWNRWWHAYKHGHDSQSFDDDGRVVKLRPSPPPRERQTEN